MTDEIKPVLFSPGSVYCTVGAQHVLAADKTPHKIIELLQRHLSGDWGDLGEEDKKANQWALKVGERILSSYRTESGEKLWVLTEADRSATTVLTPGEY